MIPKYFPYEKPRPQQHEIWMFLDELDNSNILIEAPTGVGKTAAVLSYLLEKYSRIAWFCFTKKEREVVVRELQKIQEKYPIDFIEIRSIYDACHYVKSQLLKLSKQGVCYPFPRQYCMHSKFKGCPLSPKCPFEKQFISDARVKVLTYAWLCYPSRIEPLIQKSDVVVFDECHHIILPQTFTIPMEYISRALREAELFSVKAKFITALSKREKVIEVNEDEICYLIQRGEEILYKQGISYLFEVTDIVRASSTEKLFRTKEGYQGLIILYDTLKKIAKSKKTVFISATVPKPYSRLLRNVLGNLSEYRVKQHYYDFYVIIHVAKKLPKRKWTRNIIEYIESVLNTISRFFPRIIIVFPSSDLLSKYTRIAELPLNSEVIIAGSREAEGITIKAQCVAVLGVPYDRVTKTTIETMRILKQYTKKPKLTAYTAKAVVKAVQACGRVLRNNAVVVLIDSRWLKLKKLMPYWFKSNIKDVTKSIDFLEQKIAYYSLLT
ncbi:MAG: hypothetical protein DRN04_12755 [Thermoprotei archaeon]|nr:MAG: hypothetical protein DRN04_12755 [Thermoprotei archaeon]